MNANAPPSHSLFFTTDPFSDGPWDVGHYHFCALSWYKQIFTVLRNMFIWAACIFFFLLLVACCCQLLVPSYLLLQQGIELVFWFLVVPLFGAQQAFELSNARILGTWVTGIGLLFGFSTWSLTGAVVGDCVNVLLLFSAIFQCIKVMWITEAVPEFLEVLETKVNLWGAEKNSKPDSEPSSQTGLNNNVLFSSLQTTEQTEGQVSSPKFGFLNRFLRFLYECKVYIFAKFWSFLRNLLLPPLSLFTRSCRSFHSRFNPYWSKAQTKPSIERTPVLYNLYASSESWFNSLYSLQEFCILLFVFRVTNLDWLLRLRIGSTSMVSRDLFQASPGGLTTWFTDWNPDPYQEMGHHNPLIDYVPWFTALEANVLAFLVTYFTVEVLSKPKSLHHSTNLLIWDFPHKVVGASKEFYASSNECYNVLGGSCGGMDSFDEEGNIADDDDYECVICLETLCTRVQWVKKKEEAQLGLSVQRHYPGLSLSGLRRRRLEHAGEVVGRYEAGVVEERSMWEDGYPLGSGENSASRRKSTSRSQRNKAFLEGGLSRSPSPVKQHVNSSRDFVPKALNLIGENEDLASSDGTSSVKRLEMNFNLDLGSGSRDEELWSSAYGKLNFYNEYNRKMQGRIGEKPLMKWCEAEGRMKFQGFHAPQVLEKRVLSEKEEEAGLDLPVGEDLQGGGNEGSPSNIVADENVIPGLESPETTPGSFQLLDGLIIVVVWFIQLVRYFFEIPTFSALSSASSAAEPSPATLNLSHASRLKLELSRLSQDFPLPHLISSRLNLEGPAHLEQQLKRAPVAPPSGRLGRLAHAGLHHVLSHLNEALTNDEDAFAFEAKHSSTQFSVAERLAKTHQTEKIFTDSFNPNVRLACGHQFHRQCLSNWVTSQKSSNMSNPNHAPGFADMFLFSGNGGSLSKT